MKTLSSMLYESLNVKESIGDDYNDILLALQFGMEEGWIDLDGGDFAFSREDIYNILPANSKDIDRAVHELESQGIKFKYQTSQEAVKGTGMDPVPHYNAGSGSRLSRAEKQEFHNNALMMAYRGGMSNGYVNFGGTNYAFSKEDMYNLADNVSRSDVNKVIRQLEREGVHWKYQTRDEAINADHTLEVIPESRGYVIANINEGCKNCGVGTFKKEDEEEECERCKAIRGGHESEEEEEEAATKSIKNEGDFKSYAEKKFKVVFGDNLDKDKMNKTIEGVLKDNSKAVEDGDWGKLVGILNKSFGA